MSKDKITLISNVPSSLISFRGDLINTWVKMGYKVYAMAPYFEEKHLKAVKDIGVEPVEYKLNRTGLNLLKDGKSIKVMYEKLIEIDTDYIFAYTIKPVVYSSLISKKLTLKGMYSLIPGLGYAFSNLTFKSKIIKRIVTFLYKISLENNDKIFFQNPDDMNLFIKKNLISERKTVLVNGSGVDIDEYYESEPQTEKIIFLIMARLLKSKGIKQYIKAAKIIKKEYPDVEFNILGSPGKGPDAVKMNCVNEAHKNNIVNYLGRKGDVKPFIANSSVYVLPSYYREGTPRSILEAMSMGKPIITTDNPGCRETVIDGKNGFLIPIKDHEVLADRIKYFIENKKEIVRMGKESRKLAEKKYDVHKVNDRIIKAMNLKKY